MKKTPRIALSLFVSILVGGTLFVVSAEETKKEETATKSAKADKPQSKVYKATATKEDPVSPYHAATRQSSTPAGGDVVITNEYLEKMMAGLTDEQRMSGVYQASRHIGDPPSTEAPAQGQGQPSDTDSAAGAGGTERQPASSTKSVDELSAKVDALEKRLLALKNPLLPRRYAEKTDDEDPDWDEKDNLERVEQTQRELEEARAELEEAKKRSGSR